VVAVTLLYSIGLFFHAGHVTDWLSSGDTRSTGSEGKLEDVLKARAHWIDFSFTPLAIFIGKVAARVCLLRWIATRHDEETYAPGFLLGGVVQYVAFKQGADVHIFWPHYFGCIAEPEGRPRRYEPASQFLTVHGLWRQFCAHQFLAYALEELLAAVLDALVHHQEGLTEDDLLDTLVGNDFLNDLSQVFACKCSRPHALHFLPAACSNLEYSLER